MQPLASIVAILAAAAEADPSLPSSGAATAIAIGGVLFAIALVAGIVLWVRALAAKGLEEARRVARGGVILSDAMGSWVARSDRGPAQAKGNAALVLSESTLVCVRWVPRETTVIERGELKSAQLANRFAGRWLPGKPRILVLDIERRGAAGGVERFQVGLMPRDPARWLAALDDWRGRRR
jgi:hypothetical protein